jgi:hypothetical protein
LLQPIVLHRNNLLHSNKLEKDVGAFIDLLPPLIIFDEVIVMLLHVLSARYSSLGEMNVDDGQGTCLTAVLLAGVLPSKLYGAVQPRCSPRVQ